MTTSREPQREHAVVESSTVRARHGLSSAEDLLVEGAPHSGARATPDIAMHRAMQHSYGQPRRESDAPLDVLLDLQVTEWRRQMGGGGFSGPQVGGWFPYWPDENGADVTLSAEQRSQNRRRFAGRLFNERPRPPLPWWMKPSSSDVLGIGGGSGDKYSRLRRFVWRVEIFVRRARWSVSQQWWLPDKPAATFAQGRGFSQLRLLNDLAIRMHVRRVVYRGAKALLADAKKALNGEKEPTDEEIADLEDRLDMLEHIDAG